MLPKKHRLPLRFSRNQAESTGHSLHTPLFTLVSSSSPGSDSETRFAFIVSKKISGRAVDRNSVRRRLTASLLPFLSSLKPGFDIIIYAKKPLLEAKVSDISGVLLTSLRRFLIVK